MDAEFSAHPTFFLPSLDRISSRNALEVARAVHKLQALYWKPPPRPATISLPKRPTAKVTHGDSVPDSGYASAEEDEDDLALEEAIAHFAVCDPAADALHILRTDLLERAFVIKWLTGFITRSDAWIELASSDEDSDARTRVLDEASALLAAFSGDSDEGESVDEAILRSFSFPSPDGSVIEVDLNDAPLLEDDHTSVGLQSWGSSIRLGERLCAAPAEFSLSLSDSGQRKHLRVLELGAGTGLLSILAAKILGDQACSSEIVATDYHPDVLDNLMANVAANFPVCGTPPVAVHALDWESPVYSGPLDTSFDVIFAADVIYETNHARWIRGCVERLLVRPNIDSPDGGVFWMIMALREVGRREGLDSTVYEMFPDAAQVEGEARVGLTLGVLKMEEKGKLEGIGRADETGYKLFKIGWVGPDTVGRR